MEYRLFQPVLAHRTRQLPCNEVIDVVAVPSWYLTHLSADVFLGSCKAGSFRTLFSIYHTSTPRMSFLYGLRGFGCQITWRKLSAPFWLQAFYDYRGLMALQDGDTCSSLRVPSLLLSACCPSYSCHPVPLKHGHGTGRKGGSTKGAPEGYSYR
jgi:hypothetical protein